MMIHDQLRDLKAAIRQDRIELVNLQNDLVHLQDELTVFRAQYDALITPWVRRIEVVQSAIHTLEHDRLVQISRESTPTPETTPETEYIPVEEQYRRVYQSNGRHVRQDIEDDGLESWLPPDYVSVEEQYRRNMGYDTSKYAADDFVPPVLTDAYEADARAVKRLYRKLARHCHPDFASDDADALYRTQVMAEINDAYAEKDLEALQLIYIEVVGENDDDAVDFDNPEELLSQYRMVHKRLRREVYDIKQEIFDLKKSDLMVLRHNANTLHRREGRDLLREMANEMESEYIALQKRLDDLR